MSPSHRAKATPRRGSPGATAPVGRTRWVRLGAPVAAALFLLLAAGGEVDAQPPVVALPQDVSKALEALGEGTVGRALPAKPIREPARLRHLAEGTWTYRVLVGPHAGQRQEVTVAPISADDPGAGWRVATGDEDIQTLVVTENHEVVKLSQTDLGSDRIVSYRPGLVLDPDMSVGESKTVERSISTYKTRRPDSVEYNGSLRYTTRYIGLYEIQTPAGRFEARLLSHEYEMKIGPAKASNESLDFYVDDVGNVASVSRESVSAIFIYNRKSESARILLERPPD